MGERIKLCLLRLTALLCGVLCLFSAVMSGTYGWESKQTITNDLHGSADIMMSVVLEKLEKGSNLPVAGAVFYLYREDGTQIGGRYVTNEFGMVCVQLGLGNYYFQEERAPVGYTFDRDGEGNAVTRYPFTVTAQDTPITVTAYNIRLSGALIISKTVKNSDGTAVSEGQKETEFAFTVSFSDGGTYAYRIGDEKKLLTSGDTLSLRHGESAVFESVPVGVLYDVSEAPVPGYTTASTGHRGNITETGAVAEFVNVWQGGGTGTLMVTKEVRGEGFDPQQEFTFIATIGGVQEVFTLKHSQYKEFSNIALGTSYEIREESCAGYTASVEKYEGVVNAAETVALPFVNTCSTATPPERGSLTISKTVTGLSTACTDSFYFQVQFTGDGAPADTAIVLNGLNNYTETITDIPVGVGYTVTEVLAQGYLPMWTRVSGTIHSGEETAAFINRAQSDPTLPEGEPVDITVTKVLQGETIPADEEREFRMTMLLDGEAISFTLKNGQSRTFTDVPYGAVYELREEDYITEGFSQSIVNGSGIATEDTHIVVTNTYVDAPRVEISGEKKWSIPEGLSLILPESITVRLLDGERIVEEQTVIPDGENRWHYTFTAPKYRGDGTEIRYTVAEEPVEGFHISYDGYDITNTYVAPITDNDPPVIIKRIEGENAPLSTFTFSFEGQQGAPMPDGAVGFRKEVSVTGSGEVEIGAITFTKAGTYVYTVSEKQGREKGWTYDTAVYTVTYEVREDPVTHQLSAARTIEITGTAVTDMVFTNRYSEVVTEMVTISGRKMWEHRGNPVGNRPTSVIIEIYGDGQRVFQMSLTQQEDWRYSVDLPKYADDGHMIVYTVDEQPVNGYDKEINGYDITNTYHDTTPDPTPGAPDTPEPPDTSVESGDTGDHSHNSVWFSVSLASLLGMVAALRVLQANTYHGRRVHTAKRLKKK
ncbi:MAG: Cna B-type domain-containing protein [Oscillospiraceae bacterium]|nr:Cna B-type domain-containing protein [Oscillospiraceae bacterium]